MSEGFKVGALDIQQTALHVAFHVALDRKDSEEVRRVLNDYALMMKEIVAYCEFSIADEKEWNLAARGLLDPKLAIAITENAKEHAKTNSKKGKSK